MMTNGKMEKSTKKVAVLGDVESETFGQLLEFAYKGLCGMADTTSYRVIPAMLELPLNYRCHWCGESALLYSAGDTLFPFCCEQHRRSYHIEMADRGDKIICCVVHDCLKTWGMNTSHGILCSDHYTLELRQEHHSLADIANWGPAFDPNRMKSFLTRTYGCGDLSPEDLREHLERHRDTNTPHQPSTPISHAKFYVLANKYLVQDLQDISLHKLHRDLSTLKITDTSVDEVIDLVLYTYSNTSVDGDIAKGTADKLRDLVMGFVAWQAKELTKYEAFRQMLAAGGARTADFMALTFAPPAPKTT